jgi:hypothetical protein
VLNPFGEFAQEPLLTSTGLDLLIVELIPSCPNVLYPAEYNSAAWNGVGVNVGATEGLGVGLSVTVGIGVGLGVGAGVVLKANILSNMP